MTAEGIVLRVTLRHLAALNRRWEAVTNALNEAEAAMRATPEGQAYAEAQDAWTSLREEMTQAQADARLAILDAYAATGSKKPAPGAGIRVNRDVVYDFDEAMAWCRESAPALLTLHIAAFRKAALAGLPGAPAEIVERPTATIASDLSMYLEDAE